MRSPDETPQDPVQSCCLGSSDTAESPPKCAADRFIGENVQLLFVKPQNQWHSCNKLLHFGYGKICTCPERIKYYKKYGS
jgi:hypothetical protein